MPDPSFSELITLAAGIIGGSGGYAGVRAVRRRLNGGDYVTEALCKARIATIEALLGALNDKVDVLLQRGPK